MSMFDSQGSKPFAWPLYFIAFLLVVTPTMDLVSNIWPLRLNDVDWRYGSVGLLAGFLLTPLIGMLLACGVSILFRHRMVLRVLSVANVVVAVFLLVLTCLFALDVVQVRTSVPEEARGVFRVGAAKAALKHVSMAVALVWIGVAGIRVTRSGAKGRGHRSKTDDVQLVRSEGATEPIKDDSD